MARGHNHHLHESNHPRHDELWMVHPHKQCSLDPLSLTPLIHKYTVPPATLPRSHYASHHARARFINKGPHPRSMRSAVPKIT